MFPDSVFLTSFSIFLSFAMFTSRMLESSSHSFSILFLSSFNPLILRARVLFSSLLLWFLFYISLIWYLKFWISVDLLSHWRLRFVFPLRSSSMSMLAFWSWTLKSSIYPLNSMMAFLSMSDFTLNGNIFTFVLFLTFIFLREGGNTCSPIHEWVR